MNERDEAEDEGAEGLECAMGESKWRGSVIQPSHCLKW